jgi:hypothetical protein
MADREVPPDEWISYVPSHPADLDGPPPTYEGDGGRGEHDANRALERKAEERAKLPPADDEE